MGIDIKLPVDSGWAGWKSHLTGAPTKLLIICAVQFVLLVINFFIEIGSEECEIQIHGQNDVEVICSNCRKHTFIRWQGITLFVLGIIVLIIGTFAGCFRSQKLCKVYGGVMIVFAFFIGLTCLLTGLNTAILSTAQGTTSDSTCKTYLKSMVFHSTANSFFYGLSCILDVIGAIYAIKSKQLFDFQEIASHHDNYQKSLLL